MGKFDLRRKSAAITRREPDTGENLAPPLAEKREALHSYLEKVFDERNQDDNERYEELRKWLAGDEYVLPTRELVECYFDWLNSNRVNGWPFEGGRLMQPEWVLSVWRTLERIDEYYKLKKKVIAKVSIIETMP